MTTTNIRKTKPNETKAWFGSPFAPSSQEMNRACSTAPGACMGPISCVSKMVWWILAENSDQRWFINELASGVDADTQSLAEQNTSTHNNIMKALQVFGTKDQSTNMHKINVKEAKDMNW